MRKLRVPVVFHDGVWELAVGGAVPAKQGAKAELLVDSRHIDDKDFIARMQQEGRHQVLKAGESLLFMLTIKPDSLPKPELMGHLKGYETLFRELATDYLDPKPNLATTYFIEVALGKHAAQKDLLEEDQGGLWLITEGVKATGLVSPLLVLPKDVAAESVYSLNHAYTKLSEVYETWRISHTGNVYSRVLYREHDGKWYPLEMLRESALEREKLTLAHRVWTDFLAKMKAKDS